MNAKKSVLFCGIVAGLITTLHAQRMPGLYESRYQSRNITNNNYPAPTNARIVPAPYAANAWGRHPNSNQGANLGEQYLATEPGPNDTIITNWPPPAELYAGFGNNTAVTFRYTGYINIPDGSNRVSFLTIFDTGKRLVIDGNVQYCISGDGNEYGIHGSATLTLATGWHKFDLWFEDNGGNGWGTVWWEPKTGFGIDWQGRNSADLANFVFPEDPGDGSLFLASPPPDKAVITSGAAKNAGSTFASLPVDLGFDPDDHGTLLVYYGLVDGGDVESGWDASVAYGEVTVSGSYEIPMTGLEFDKTYYYRHALRNASGLHFAPASRSFRTYVTVASQPVVSIGLGSASLPGSLTVVSGESGVLRVYYGTVNGAATTEWQAFADYNAGELLATSGTYVIPLAGLVNGARYYYRHAFETPDGHISFAPATLEFSSTISVESRAATSIGATSAVLPANLPVVPSDAGVLRVYYGPAGNAAVTNSVDFAGTLVAGVNSIAVDGLTLGATYWFRHAYVVNVEGGDPVYCYAPASFSFTTIDESLPFRFAYSSLGGTVDWHNPAAWINLDKRARLIPGMPGDSIQIAENLSDANARRSRNHVVTNDISLGVILAGFYEGESWISAEIRPDGASSRDVTLTMDNSPLSGSATIRVASLNRFFLGRFDDRNNTRMTIALAQLLAFSKTNYGETDFFLYAALTGGTHEKPCPVTISNTAGWSFFRFVPYNPWNDFVGDIILQSTGDRCALHIGAWINNGDWVWHAPNDAYMGDPSNRIIMTHSNCRLAIEDAQAFILNRTILGTGMIRASQMPWGSGEEESLRSLTLGERCVLAPGIDDSVPGIAPALGTLTLRGSELVMNPATRVKIKLTPTSSDTLALQFSGAVAFNGLLDVGQLTPTEHIKANTTWTIITPSTPRPFSGRFQSVTPHYRVDYNTNTEGKLTSVTLTKLNAMTLFLLK